MRSLRHKPWFSLVAIGTLAVGICACTVVFTLVEAILLKPLPYRHASSVVTVLHPASAPVSPADFLDWKRSARSFEDLEAAYLWGATLVSDDTVPEEITGLQMTPGMFRLLGDEAALGRTFLPGMSGDEREVVLSDSIWRRRFGSNPAIVGRKIRLNGESYEVLGVMAPDFRFPPFWATAAELWVPFDVHKMPGSRQARMLRVFGNLAPHTDLRQAQAEMNTIAARIAMTFPESNAGLAVTVEPLAEKAAGKAKEPVLVLFGAVGLLMLIASSNVAGLMLARSIERKKEIGVRIALGASAGQILRQVLAESMALGMAGGTVGALLAAFMVRVVGRVLSGAGNDAAKLSTLQIDGMTLLFAAGLAVITSVVFGLAPALQSRRIDVASSLRESSRGASEGRGGLRLRSVLVVGETALCLMLLAGAGVLMRSYSKMRAIDPGFNSRSLLTMSISAAGRDDLWGERREAFFRNVLTTLRQMPGVTAAGMVNHLPVGGDTWGTRVAAEGAPLPEPGKDIGSVFRISGAGYLGTMNIPLVRGRDFTEADRQDAPRVAIVNEKLARKLWPGGEDPIGHRLTLDDPRKSPKWMTVVGIIRDVRQNDFLAEPDAEVYVPWLQQSEALNSTGAASASMTLVLRTSFDPMQLVERVRAAVAGIDKGVAVAHVRSADRILDSIFWQSKMTMAVTGLFAALALLLACVGIYGVMAYIVGSRLREVGIRMALGADRASVLGMFLRQGMILIGSGVAIGLAGALIFGKGMSAVVYGISPSDPLTLIAAPVVLLLTGLTAVLMPAFRAASSAPVETLRDK